MSGRIRSVTPKPGFVFDGQSVIPVPRNVIPMRDGLANIMTGRGTSVDRGTQNFWHRRFTNPQQVEAAYLGSWLHRKIVDIPAQDMTRAGRDWDAEDDQIAAIEKEEKRLGYWQKIHAALTLGRLGGGAIVIGLGADPTQQLPAFIRPGQIAYLSVLSRWQLTLGERETDPVSPMFGEPRHFVLAGDTRQTRIHPSRVVCFKGLPVPAMLGTAWDDHFWGMSVVEAVDEAVQQATTACAGFAALIDEAKIDVFRFGGMAETIGHGPEGEATVMKRVELTTQGKSIHRAVILDKDDEWDQRQLTLAGVRDVIITYDGRVAGAADIPATRLFGKAPDGQNSTGEGDMLNYHQSIGAKQEMELRAPVERLDAVMLPSAGVPSGLSWSFSPLNVLTKQQAADIELKEAQSLEKLVGLALVPESAMAKTVQNRLIESQRFPGLKKLIEEAESAGEELPGGDEPELGIVPVGAKGGDRTSAGGGAVDPIPARRAANDAAIAQLRDAAGKLGLNDLVDDWLGGAPTGGRPFDDGRRISKGQRLARRSGGSGFDPSQPRDRHGRWIPSGIRDMMARASSGDTSGKAMRIGTIGARAAAMGARAGVGVAGKSVSLDPSLTRHLIIRHGNEQRAGQKSVRGGDIAAAATLFNGAKVMRKVRPAKNGAPRIAAITYSKGERIYSVFEQRKYTVVLVTMWKR